jgi:tetratricopeptide (TPR) repeat protein
LQQGRAADAVELADRAKVLRPVDLHVRMLLVDALRQSGQIKRAEQEAQATVTAWPGVAAAHAQLATLQLATDRPQDARRSLEKALAIDPSSMDALTTLTALDLQEKHGDEAVRRIEQHLKQSPDSPSLLLLAGRSFAAGGAKSKAEEALRRLIELEPSNLQAFATLGQLYLYEGRLEEARGQFEELAERAPTPAARTMVGMILEAQHRRDDAKRAYEQTLASYPRAAIAANNLACLYLDEGRVEEALRLALVAKEELRTAPEINDTLGWAYYHANQPRDAITALSVSVDARPDNPTYRYHRGIAYAKAGYATAAREDLRLALESKTPFAGRDEAVTVAQRIDAEAQAQTATAK